MFLVPLLIGCIIHLGCCLNGQNHTVFLHNASFEDAPLPGKPPVSWYYCGSSLETPPDIHPSGFFGVNQSPKDGETYVGLVVRTNNTWEGLGQLLEKPLLKGQNYRFCMFACLSANYQSVDRVSLQPLNYNKAVIIRIWGSSKSCEQEELLAQSEAIDHSDWKEICFQFTPNHDSKHIRIEAYFAEAETYGGSVLIDDCSAFIPYNKEKQSYDLEIPQLDLKEDLSTIIAKYGTQIKFASSTFVSLEKHLFYDQQNQLQEGNLPLWNIALALQQHTNEKIIIQLSTLNRANYKARKKIIQQVFKQLDISRKQYKIQKKKNAQQIEIILLSN